MMLLVSIEAILHVFRCFICVAEIDERKVRQKVTRWAIVHGKLHDLASLCARSCSYLVMAVDHVFRYCLEDL